MPNPLRKRPMMKVSVIYDDKMFATRGKLSGKLANSTSASGEFPQIEKGYPLYISVTFAWFDRVTDRSLVDQSKLKRSIAVLLVLERIRQIF